MRGVKTTGPGKREDRGGLGLGLIGMEKPEM